MTNKHTENSSLVLIRDMHIKTIYFEMTFHTLQLEKNENLDNGSVDETE